MNEARDEWEGVKAEIGLHAPTERARADLYLNSPPPEHAIPSDFLDTIRGRSITVASFQEGQQTPTFHRRLRAWSDVYATTPQGETRTVGVSTSSLKRTGD